MLPKIRVSLFGIFVYTLFTLFICFPKYSLAEELENNESNLSNIYNVSYKYSGDLGTSEYSFYYRDSMLVEQNANEFSGELAKASVGLAVAAYGKDGDIVKNAFVSMGFSENDITDKGSYDVVTTISSNDSVAYTIAKKKVGDYYIYIVPVRGTPTSAEWYSNFDLGDRTDGYHSGFYQAAIDVMGNLMEVIKQDGTDKEHTIIWTMGHSRGAAVANIIAGEMSLNAKYALPEHIFGYTFACPAVKENIQYSYTNIYNYNYSGDLIPELPLSKWGYDRYGATIDFLEEDPNGRIFENEILQFRNITSNTFNGVKSTDNYLNILNGIIDSKESFNTPEGKLAFTMLAWLLEGKNTSKQELIGYIGMNISNDYASMIKCQLFGNDNISNLKEEDMLSKQSKIVQILELMNEKEDELDKAKILEDNNDFIEKLENQFEISINDYSDLLTAKLKIENYLNCLDRSCNIYKGVIDVFVDAEYSVVKVADAIKHGHTPETYIVWINSLYCGYKGWYYNSAINNIDSIISKDISVIGDRCFAYCSGMSELVIPDSIYVVGKNSFAYCNNIKKITLPIDLEYVKLGVYDTSFRCLSVSDIVYTKGRTGKMPDRSTIDYPENVFSYYLGTLEQESRGSIKNITFEPGVTEIGAYCFNVTFSSGELKFHGMDNINKIGDYAFHDSLGSSSYSLSPSSCIDGIDLSNVMEIGEHAFTLCSGLKFADLSNAKNIGDSAFEGCYNLQQIKLSNELNTIGDYCFKNCEVISVDIPDNTLKIGKGAFSYCDNLEEVIIPCDIEYGEGAFKYTNISKVTYTSGNTGIIPNGSYNSISYDAGGTLKEIVVDEGITQIGNNAFRYDMSVNTTGNLEKVTLPTTLKEIGNRVFWREINLQEIDLPEGLEKLGEHCFDECTQLKMPDLPSTLSEIPDWCFGRCLAVVDLILPDNIKKVGGYAFYMCSNLKNVTISCDIDIAEDRVSSFYGTKVERLTYTKGTTGIITNTSILNELSGSLNVIILDEGVIKIEIPLVCSKIIIPTTVTYISDDCFNRSGGSILLYGTKDSYAEEYANSRHLIFVPFEYPVIGNFVESSEFIPLNKYVDNSINLESDSNVERQLKGHVYKDIDQYTEDVTWSVERNESDNTTISENGLLTISSDEKAKEIDIVCKYNDIKSIITLPVIRSSYVISFDVNGGTSTVDSMKTDKFKQLSSLPEVENANYAFDGWFTDKVDGKKISTDTVFDDDTTVYAHWSKTPIDKIEFDDISSPVIGVQLDDTVEVYSKEIDKDSITVEYLVDNQIVDGTAKCDTSYIINISFILNEGYTLTNDSVILVNNDKVDVISNENDIYLISLSYDSTGHGKTELKDVKQPACEVEGYTGDVYCTICNNKVETGVMIEATGHTPAKAVKEKEVAETCTTAGSYEEVIYCSVCNKELSREKKTVSASGHDWGEWILKTPATEINEGLEERVCNNDVYHKETRSIANFHSKPVIDDKDRASIGETTTTGDKTAQTTDEILKLTDTPVTKDTTFTDDSTKATFVVTSTVSEEPKVKYKAALYVADKTVTIPDAVTIDGVTYKVTEIADDALANNKTVEKVVISYNIESIGDGAFSGCTNLKSVSISASVTEIGDKAFKGCTSLKNIKIGNGVMEIGDSAFKGCKKLKSVTIGSKVIEIGDNAFANCTALTKIIIPAKVTKLGKNVFKSNKKLKTIIIKTTKLTDKTVSKNAFKGIGNKVTIKLPKKMKKIYTKLFRKKGLSKKVKIK